jgi:hypothetical protein
VYYSTTSTLFDLAQTVWALSLVCFTVIVMKLTKYINIAYKRERMTPALCEFRETLCILLAKVNGILIGKYKADLSKAKYYLKYPLDP